VSTAELAVNLDDAGVDDGELAVDPNQRLRRRICTCSCATKQRSPRRGRGPAGVAATEATTSGDGSATAIELGWGLSVTLASKRPCKSDQAPKANARHHRRREHGAQEAATLLSTEAPDVVRNGPIHALERVASSGEA